ncbi:MAG: flagellar FliJ family protein [Gemmatimonadales bacterium]|nr:flagellar FliJ family protein [Gemmatimonadales bacterium]
MKRFQFRLERLLQLRTREEEERARDLVAARRQEADARARVEDARRRHADARGRLADATADAQPAGAVQNLALAVDAAEGRLRAEELAAGEATRVAEVVRQAFDAARAARRALERLKETRRDTWLRDAERTDQAWTDEVALRRAATVEQS